MKVSKNILSNTTYGCKTTKGNESLDLRPLRTNWYLIALIVLVFSILIAISPLPLKFAALILVVHFAFLTFLLWRK